MQLFTNNASTLLSAGIGTGDTTITVSDGSIFSSPTGSDFQLLTLTNGAIYEIVKMTARTGDSLTVTRAQEGTTAQAWTTSDTISSRVTKGTLEALQLNTATGADSLAIGTGADGSAADVVALGSSATAAANGVSIGKNSAAAGASGTVAVGSSSSAAGARAVAAGASASAAGAGGIAVGEFSDAGNGANNIAIGASAFISATITRVAAIGSGAFAAADDATAIGSGATARLTDTINFSGIPIARKDTGQSNVALWMTTPAAVLCSKEVDLKATAADDVTTIEIPAGAHFFPDEVQIIITASDTVTGDPSVAVGTTTGGGELRASAAVTETNQFERNIDTAVSRHGITGTINISLKTAATATTLKGRVVITGFLVEDE